MNQENNKNGIDFSKRLDKSTAKPQDKQERPSGSYVSPFAPKIIRWLIKYSGGLIKNENQAFHVLLGFIVFAFILSLFLIFGRGGGLKTSEPTGPAIEEAGSPKDITPH